MADGTESTSNTGDGKSVDSDEEDGPGIVGTGLRSFVAFAGLCLGSIWMVRLLFVGPTITDGLLFELLAPLLLLYLGVRYLGTQIVNIRALRRRYGEQ